MAMSSDNTNRLTSSSMRVVRIAESADRAKSGRRPDRRPKFGDGTAPIVDIDDFDEVEIWSRRLGVSTTELRNAIARFGNNISDVAVALGKPGALRGT